MKNLNLKKIAGFLGPEGTFSWVAAEKFFPKNFFLKPLVNIKEIFKEILKKEISLGVVPIENSTAGLVSETVCSFIDYPVYALGSFEMPIHHSFASKGKQLKKIKIIKSHPQALSQCRKWLEKNLSQAVEELTQSTIAPVLEESSEITGFILPSLAAKKHGLNVLAENIEDSKKNFTKFFIIASSLKKSFFQKLNLKTKNTLLLISVYDRVGILRDILSVFADNNLNLTSLHSIPSRLKPWDYFFFLEVEVSINSEKIKKILKKLKEYCPLLRVIGAS